MEHEVHKSDLTLIYYTSNTINEGLGEKIRQQLLRAKGDHSLLSISQKPMEFGRNICVGDIGASHMNIYKQILIGAREAETEYVALCEDDTLYSPTHFDYRPPKDVFAYDMTKWSLYTWKPVYSVKRRASNAVLICSRELLVETLEERFEKASDKPLKYWGEPGRYEQHLGVTPRKKENYYSKQGVVILTHPDALGYGALGTRKRLGNYLAYDVHYWGHVNNIMEDYLQ